MSISRKGKAGRILNGERVPRRHLKKRAIRIAGSVVPTPTGEKARIRVIRDLPNQEGIHLSSIKRKRDSNSGNSDELLTKYNFNKFSKLMVTFALRAAKPSCKSRRNDAGILLFRLGVIW